MKGYCAAADVAAYMGRTFTPGQTALCEQIIGATENWIDNHTQHAWLESGTQTLTAYSPRNPFITLPKAPIATLDVVTNYISPYYTTGTVLVDGVNYWLIDPRDGRISFPGYQGTYKLVFEYTPNADPTPPDEVVLATLIIAASRMQVMPVFFEGVDPSIIQEYTVGGELQVVFRNTNTTIGTRTTIPQAALDYLDAWLKGYTLA